MSLDTEAIKQELAALNHQRHEVNERIRSLAPMRGRGRGFRGRGLPGPPGLAPYGRRDFGDRDAGANWDFGPIDGPPNPLDRRPPRRPFLARGPLEAQPTGDRYEAPHQAAPKRKVQSAVVVDGEARTAHEVPYDAAQHGSAYPPELQPSEGSKRPAEGELMEDNPALKKRNRRLFGALLGTLQKFKEEEQREASSDVAQRRAKLLQRAEVKKEEEARRLRQEARQEMQNRRVEEIHRKREINMLSDIKRLELLYAEKLARHDRLSAFLKTKTGPSVFWCPKQHSHITLKLAEQQRQELQRWKAEQLEQLEVEKKELRERFERAATRGEPLGQEGEGDAGGEGDEHAENGGVSGVEEAAAAGAGEKVEGQPGKQPAADDRYEAVPVGQGPHDDDAEEMMEDREASPEMQDAAAEGVGEGVQQAGGVANADAAPEAEGGQVGVEG